MSATVQTELQSLRSEIDKIDAQIVGLLASRFRVTARTRSQPSARLMQAVTNIPH